MAIWSNTRVAGVDHPGRLLAQSDPRPAGNGINEVAIAAHERPILEPGQVYWVGVNVNSDGLSMPQVSDDALAETIIPLSFSESPGVALDRLPTVGLTPARKSPFFVRGKLTY